MGNWTRESAIRCLAAIIRAEGPKRVPASCTDDTWIGDGSDLVIYLGESEDGETILVEAITEAEADERN